MKPIVIVIILSLLASLFLLLLVGVPHKTIPVSGGGWILKTAGGYLDLLIFKDCYATGFTLSKNKIVKNSCGTVYTEALWRFRFDKFHKKWWTEEKIDAQL